MTTKTVAAFSVCLLLLGAAGAGAQAAGAKKSGATASTRAGKPTIVLVHGAFADASSFQYLIPLLQNDGYNVVAVQNPLSSLADDIATTKRLIDAQKGPVVVVGHSYGGVVISGAASGNPNVRPASRRDVHLLQGRTRSADVCHIARRMGERDLSAGPGSACG